MPSEQFFSHITTRTSKSTDSLIDNNKMNCLATSSPRSSEESIHSPRSKKTDISSENKPKWLQFVKEDGDIPVHSLNSSQFSGDTIKSNHTCYL
jgi:hypothetical protein